MSTENLGWFHCGRCGRLFQSMLGAGPHVCGNCGNDSSLPEEPLAGLRHAAASPDLRAKRIEADDEAAARKRKARTRRRNLIVTKMCVGWVLFLVAVVFISKQIWREDEKLSVRSQDQPLDPGVFSEADAAFLNEAAPLCGQKLSRFLAAGDPEERSQFVRKPLDTLAKMVRFYRQNTLPPVVSRDLTVQSHQLLRIGGEPVVAITWASKDGLVADSMFFKEGNEWRLDWEHFVRYSDFLWPLFQAGEGPDTGEFRLLVRRRLLDEKGFSPVLSVAFYAPRFGKPQEIGNASPEFVIERGSENGRMLAAAFREAQKGTRPFGEKSSAQEPDGMVRVRVKIKRTNGEKGRQFELEKVVACHWLAIDDPGVVPLTEAEAAAREETQAPKRAE